MPLNDASKQGMVIMLDMPSVLVQGNTTERSCTWHNEAAHGLLIMLQAEQPAYYA
jgi:hypothetical protein